MPSASPSSIVPCLLSSFRTVTGTVGEVWTVRRVLYSTFNHTVNASGGQYSPVILALANDRRLDCFEPGPKKKKKSLCVVCCIRERIITTDDAPLIGFVNHLPFFQLHFHISRVLSTASGLYPVPSSQDHDMKRSLSSPPQSKAGAME